MSGYIIYTTADGKIISVADIFYIDVISNGENETKQYKVMHQNGDAIIVSHPDEQILKKDKRKLELTWEKYLRYRK